MSYVFIDRKCNRCDGSGEIGGFDGLKTCPKCNGIGIIGSYEEVLDIQLNGDKEFGTKLRKTRERRLISMYELAKLLHCMVSRISSIELGIEMPTEKERKVLEKWING